MPASTVQIVIQAVNQASGPINQVNQSLQGVNRHAHGASQSVGGMNSQFAKTASLVQGVLIGMLAFQAVRLPGAMISTAIEAYAAYERLGLTLNNLLAVELRQTDAALTMSQALTQTKEQSKELIKWTEQLAVYSPFTQETVTYTLQTAMGYGMNADMAQKLTQALADYAAGTGRSEEQTKLLGLALGQVWSKGRLTGEEMRQLTNAGMGVELMATAAGLSLKEFSEMMKEGELDARQLIPRLIALSDERFAGAAKAQATSWAGLLSTLDDIVKIGLREFFTDTFTYIQPLFADFLNGWPQLKKDLSEAGEGFAQFAANFMRAMPSMQRISEELGGAWANISRLLTDAWERTRETAKAMDLMFGTGFLSQLDKFGEDVKAKMADTGRDLWRPLIDMPEALQGLQGDSLKKAVKFYEDIFKVIIRIPSAVSEIGGAARGAISPMGSLGKETQDTSGRMRSLIASSSELISYLVSIDPAALAAAAAVDTLRLRLVGLKDQQAGLQESIRTSQDVLRGLQDQVSGLESALSAAKQKLTDLASPQLEGMGALDEQIFQIQQQIKRLKLEEMGLDSSAFKPMTEEAKKFAATLPSSIEELEDMLEALGLQKSLEFDELLRKIAEEAKGAAKELTFEEAIEQIRTTKAEIGNLETNLAGARAAAEAQAAAIESMRRAADDMTKAIQQMQQDLQIQEERQKLVNDALKIAYDWFINDREKLMEMGGEAVTQAGIIDTATRDLLSLTSQYAQGEAAEAIRAIEAALNAYRLARVEMAGGLFGAGALLPPIGGEGGVPAVPQSTIYAGNQATGNSYYQNFSLILNNPTDKSNVTQNFLTLKALAGA